MAEPYGQNASSPPPVGFAVPGTEMAFSNEEATAPPLDDLVIPPGYQNSSFTPAILQPPSLPSDNQYDPSSINRTIPKFDEIKEDEIKNALKQFVSENFCYGSKPAEELEISDIVMKNSFRYKLQTFTERRETKWKYEPFLGGAVDGPHNGGTPDPWEIFVPPLMPFENGTKKVEVPHSSTVRHCHKCFGRGRIYCYSCRGQGGKSCFFCHGSGRKDDDHSCFHCNGTGRDRCIHCHGYGRVNCNTCKGYGQIRCYIQLIVHWTNHPEDYVIDETGLSDLIKGVAGSVLLDERYPRVFPLENFPDESISRTSKGLIDKHRTAFPKERILEQRHKLLIIPVALVYYKWRLREEGCFYVYGLDHKVCFDDYPAKCCCGVCTIL